MPKKRNLIFSVNVDNMNTEDEIVNTFVTDDFRDEHALAIMSLLVEELVENGWRFMDIQMYLFGDKLAKDSPKQN